MAFNPDVLIYKKTIELEMFNPTTGALNWLINDVKDPSLKTSADSTVATDALGSTVATIYKAKKAQLTGSNAFFSLSLTAAQYGTSKKVASASAKLVTPKTEIITVGETAGTKNTTITLAQTPYGKVAGSEIPFIYIREANKSIGTSYAVATVASATNFSITGKVITLPTATEITSDTIIIVFYEYETASAISVANNANDIPKSGVAKMSCVFADPCDISKEYFGWIVSDNAQLTPESEIAFKTDGEHAFTIDFNKAYCSNDGTLFTIIIPEE